MWHFCGFCVKTKDLLKPPKELLMDNLAILPKFLPSRDKNSDQEDLDIERLDLEEVVSLGHEQGEVLSTTDLLSRGKNILKRDLKRRVIIARNQTNKCKIT